MRVLIIVAFVLTIAPCVVGQDATRRNTGEVRFEVASVKPNKSSDEGIAYNTTPSGRLQSINVPAKELIRSAFGLRPFELVAVPDWASTERFDIVATAGRSATEDELMLMLRSLLADRFSLRTHPEQRELPIYALVTAGNDWHPGPQLTKSSVNCDEVARSRQSGVSQKPADGTEQIEPCSVRRSITAERAQLQASALTLDALAGVLSGFVDRPIVDRSGISGGFDMTLTWTPRQTADTTGPSLFAALQEQLGLKLESARGPVEVLVVDNVERPTPD